MTAPEAKRLEALKGENAKLKKLLAEQMCDMVVMNDPRSRSKEASVVRREAVRHPCKLDNVVGWA